MGYEAVEFVEDEDYRDGGLVIGGKGVGGGVFGGMGEDCENGLEGVGEVGGLWLDSVNAGGLFKIHVDAELAPDFSRGKFVVSLEEGVETDGKEFRRMFGGEFS